MTAHDTRAGRPVSVRSIAIRDRNGFERVAIDVGADDSVEGEVLADLALDALRREFADGQLDERQRDGGPNAPGEADLRRALDRVEDADARYHVRQALQYLMMRRELEAER